ncbi:hypothetical protein [Hymenobacter bucti]|uniref:Uncharacterized protein n=1 Tax=Hymenobacter bucti TaxID=1844114 RepID=A0ABW4QXY0_9BACT
MSQRLPSAPDPVKALLQAQGLQQPSAAFSAALTRQVVARYAAPPVAPYQAGAWLGKAILLVLGSLLGLVLYVRPLVTTGILAPSLAAAVLGLGGVLWLFEHYRQHQSKLVTP